MMNILSSYTHSNLQPSESVNSFIYSPDLTEKDGRKKFTSCIILSGFLCNGIHFRYLRPQW